MFREKQLIWQFNCGHTEAVREIYDLYKHDLVTLATALLMDKSEAEDVVHDVFVGFIRSGDRFRLTGSLRGFLCTCVANRARNRNKAARRHAPDNESGSEAVVPDCERPDLAAMFGEELQHVGAALSQLPYEQREAVVLRLHGGLRFREIALAQGVSINTIQGRYRYGMDRLKSILNGQINL
jgi:RNA polymerase sigma-70 factor (ECF subfamily)